MSISRNFPGVSLYAMIATAYHLAAEQTGERYAIRFKGEALEVADLGRREGRDCLMQETVHYKLKKPGGSDYADVEVLNENADKLDEALDGQSTPLPSATSLRGSFQGFRSM